MRKIKDNGRTYKLITSRLNCVKCAFRPSGEVSNCPKEKCWDGNIEDYVVYGHWRETLPSKLSRLIKRMVGKWSATLAVWTWQTTRHQFSGWLRTVKHSKPFLFAGSVKGRYLSYLISIRKLRTIQAFNLISLPFCSIGDGCINHLYSVFSCMTRFA